MAIYRALDHIGENLVKLKDDLAKANSSELNGDPDQIKAWAIPKLSTSGKRVRSKLAKVREWRVKVTNRCRLKDICR